jgi:hypothetical protein
MKHKKNRYAAIIERIFTSKFRPGMRAVDFARRSITNLSRPKKSQMKTWKAIGSGSPIELLGILPCPIG